MKIALIGSGAISQFVQKNMREHGVEIIAIIVRDRKHVLGDCKPKCILSVSELPSDLDLLVDCAGHNGLREHGLPALKQGIDVLTVSLGALADAVFEERVKDACQIGNSKLHLVNGAIGGLDALRAARQGSLETVTYVGRKPPAGWKGSPAEGMLDLDNLSESVTHFKGSAREAASSYPKNANVAAAVALSALGFDATTVELIADPTLETNVHEVKARGDFGELKFKISGKCLPENPRSSVLAAMSVVSSILELEKCVGF